MDLCVQPISVSHIELLKERKERERVMTKK